MRKKPRSLGTMSTSPSLHRPMRQLELPRSIPTAAPCWGMTSWVHRFTAADFTIADLAAHFFWQRVELWCFATFVVFLFGSSKFLIFSGSWKILTVPCEASFVSVFHTFICDVLSSLVQSKNIPSWKTSGLSWSQKKQNHIFPNQTGWMNPTIKPPFTLSKNASQQLKKRVGHLTNDVQVGVVAPLTGAGVGIKGHWYTSISTSWLFGINPTRSKILEATVGHLGSWFLGSATLNQTMEHWESTQKNGGLL